MANDKVTSVRRVVECLHGWTALSELAFDEAWPKKRLEKKQLGKERGWSAKKMILTMRQCFRIRSDSWAWDATICNNYKEKLYSHYSPKKKPNRSSEQKGVPTGRVW